MHSPDIAVLIPCYNEALTIAKVVDDFKEELPEASIYVYDNNSSDGTGDIARSHGAIVRLEPRQGKGNVVRQMLRDIDAEYYVMIDGDDTYPADQVKNLLQPLFDGGPTTWWETVSPTARMGKKTSVPSMALATISSAGSSRFSTALISMM